MSILDRNTKLVKSIANELGFFYCGISKAEFLEDEANKLDTWLAKNYHGKMGYMENHFDKRLDPRKLVEGAKSVISLGLNYFPDGVVQNPEAPKISKYAYGNDYHEVIRDKMIQFMGRIHDEIGDVGGRVFVDSAPVMDKAWAKKSGLGWMGKNTNIIHPKKGSFFFLSELIIDLDLNSDGPIKDYCGTCTQCIDECPTEAIVEPYVIDGSKCISYLTIELKDEIIPKEFKGKMDGWMFGCDVCQDVCPWNRFSTPTKVADFTPRNNSLHFNHSDWQELTQEVFSELFKLSAIKRTKFKGLTRNISFLKEN